MAKSTLSKKSGFDDHASILSSFSSVIAEGLRGSIDSLTEKLSQSIDRKGDSYLSKAVEGVTEATEKLVVWGRQHPVKTAVAGAALVAVTATIYATMHNKIAAGASKVGAKVKSKVKKTKAKLLKGARKVGSAKMMKSMSA